jgi:tRNA G18 (ribose-2'-O)-methylase SpoU
MNRNVIDKYKDWLTEDIRLDVQRNTFPYAVLMENWGGDFNQSCLIRSANAFGAEKVFYLKRGKAYDRRGTVGTHNYTEIQHLSSLGQVRALKEKYRIIGIENGVPEAKELNRYDWDSVKEKPPLFIFGEEGCGISPELLKECDDYVFIKQWGSVRSMNVASCASIVMHEAVNKLFHKEAND